MSTQNVYPQNQLLEECFTIISIQRAINTRDISWLLILPDSIKNESTVIYQEGYPNINPQTISKQAQNGW